MAGGQNGSKRVWTIDTALRWAYRDELPKSRPDGGANLGHMATSWDLVTKYGEQLAVIDENPYGVLHDPTALGAPHPDALRIAEAVRALDDLVLEAPDDWQPWSDLGDLGALGEVSRQRALAQISRVLPDGRRVLRTEPQRLVIKYAVLSDPPDWRAERPEIRHVVGANGKPKWFRKVYVEGVGECEVDGYNQRAKRSYDDAYRKSYLDPDPADAAVWRAEWQVWVTALDLLVIELEGALETIDVRAVERPLTPWEDPDHRDPQILPALDERPLRPMSLTRGQWAALDLLARRPPPGSPRARLGGMLAAARQKKNVNPKQPR